jgi:hypothetical protein
VWWLARVDPRRPFHCIRPGRPPYLSGAGAAKDGVPHDLEHLIVEKMLGCGAGFWGRVCQGAEFSSIRVTRRGPRRRPRAWNHELTKGYSGWDEDLVTNVVRMYREARRQGWLPPAAFPPVPTMALLLDPRRRPPVHATITREALAAAAAALCEAEREWRDLPVGGALSRPWEDRRALPAVRAAARDRGSAARVHRAARSR